MSLSYLKLMNYEHLLREENQRLKGKNKELIKVMHDLNKEVDTLLSFAESINTQWDFHKILEKTKQILQDTYSQKVSIHIDNEVFAQEWVEIEGIEKIPGIKKAMYNKKIIYVSKTLEPELILGEHRIN